MVKRLVTFWGELGGFWRHLRAVRAQDRNQLLAERKNLVDLLEMHEQLEVQSKASQAEMEQQQQQLFRFTEGLAQRQQKRKAEYIEAQGQQLQQATARELDADMMRQINDSIAQATRLVEEDMLAKAGEGVAEAIQEHKAARQAVKPTKGGTDRQQ